MSGGGRRRKHEAPGAVRSGRRVSARAARVARSSAVSTDARAPGRRGSESRGRRAARGEAFGRAVLVTVGARGAIGLPGRASRRSHPRAGGGARSNRAVVAGGGGSRGPRTNVVLSRVRERTHVDTAAVTPPRRWHDQRARAHASAPARVPARTQGRAVVPPYSGALASPTPKSVLVSDRCPKGPPAHPPDCRRAGRAQSPARPPRCGSSHTTAHQPAARSPIDIGPGALPSLPTNARPRREPHHVLTTRPYRGPTRAQKIARRFSRRARLPHHTLVHSARRICCHWPA